MEKICVICKKIYITKHKKQKTCSLSCGSKYREQKQGNGLSESRTCPICKESFIAKQSYKTICCSLSCGQKSRTQNPEYKPAGGNGKLTEPQRILAQRLGNDWKTEVAIGLGKKIPGYPTCYKVDIGNRRLKLAIEIDGYGHRKQSQQVLDRKKEAKLKELGWRVIRFWNREILNDLPGVMKTIKGSI